jgi:hypothetical protein
MQTDFTSIIGSGSVVEQLSDLDGIQGGAIIEDLERDPR